MDVSGALDAFGIVGRPQQLPGGSGTTLRVGEMVLKKLEPTSLETQHSLELAPWIAELTSTLLPDGFRTPQPVATRDGAWLTADGWTAWTMVEGVHATTADIPACIDGIRAFHSALKSVPKHPLLADNRTPWGLADRWCWDAMPDAVQPQLKTYVDALYALRLPVDSLGSQLIHGDLNPANILIAPSLPPAFIDMSPFWGPVPFALGIFANWIGPRRGDADALRYFEGIEHFDQMLVRAGIRMLLVMAVIDSLDDWATCPERQAAQIIIDYLHRPVPVR